MSRVKTAQAGRGEALGFLRACRIGGTFLKLRVPTSLVVLLQEYPWRVC